MEHGATTLQRPMALTKTSQPIRANASSARDDGLVQTDRCVAECLRPGSACSEVCRHGGVEKKACRRPALSFDPTGDATGI